jgi:uncharacterized protein YmfQ (DUF2313 family)
MADVLELEGGLILEHTTRSRRIMLSLPDYYHGNVLAERLAIAFANELDRLEGEAERVRDELIPARAGDVGLAVWEKALGLPVQPVDATVEQRRSKVTARLQAISNESAITTMATLRAAAGTSQIDVLENTPGPLQDTIVLPFDPASYNAAQVEAIANVLWPAHRRIVMHYSQGFILDASRLDADSL